MYNNTCIRGADSCFHRLLVNQDKSLWEEAYDAVSDTVKEAGWQLGLVEDPQYSSDYTMKCSTTEQSNAVEIWEEYKDVFPYLADFITSHPEYLWSGANTDRTAPNFFADLDGPDNDWRLTGAAGGILIEGGKCTAPDNYKDMDRGPSRTPGWTAASGCQEETGYSIGAYETTINF